MSPAPQKGMREGRDHECVSSMLGLVQRRSHMQCRGYPMFTKVGWGSLSGSRLEDIPSVLRWGELRANSSQLKGNLWGIVSRFGGVGGTPN